MPGKHWPRPAHGNVTIDAFDMSVIRWTVQEFYITQNKVPSCRKLLPVIKHKIGFPWGVHSLRNILHKLGCRWKKFISKRKILIERPDIVNWQRRYLVKIKALCSEGRQIFYIDESWVDSNLTFKKCWQSEEVKGVCTDGNARKRLIMVHAGSCAGFLQGVELMYKAGSASGDYHSQMNSIHFKKWVREKVLPNLPPLFSCSTS
jgi:hypothetical protein